MNRTTKTITSLLVTGAAALGILGCGSSSGESTTQAAATTQAAQGTQAQAGRGRGGPALSTADLATAAKALGTTGAKLQAAMEAARPTGRPSTRSGTTGSGAAAGAGDDPRTAMYAAIAKQLGTTSAKVEAALADPMPAGGRGPGGTGGAGGAGGGAAAGAPRSDAAAGSNATGSTGSDATGTTSAS